MQILCPRCEEDERGGYSMCTRCGQHFPLAKLVLDVSPAPVQHPCERCDQEAFFGHLECGHCGRTLHPVHATQR